METELVPFHLHHLYTLWRTCIVRRNLFMVLSFQEIDRLFDHYSSKGLSDEEYPL